jgi:hypothetical protein
MNDIDAAIAAELERMVPVGAEPDWDAIARAAGLGRRRLRRPSRVLALVAALAVAATLVLVAPWDRSGGNLRDLALAAVGSQPVLHVVAELPTGVQAVEIATGASRPVVQEQEIWYDADRGLKKTVVRVGSTTLDVTLETPQGGVTAHGIVYDCAWIAAHPVEATKAHVSCNPSGDNGTTPRVIPRPKPTLDPGLSGFVDGYRQALAAGQAREAGSGDLKGRKVDWLVFRTSDGSERVALDAHSHKPVLLAGDHGLRLRIGTIETIPYAATDFSRPSPDEVPLPPSIGRATDEGDLPLEAGAIAAAMPNALWAGKTLNGLPLVKAERQTLHTAFSGKKPPLEGPGLELDYGSLDSRGRLDRSQPYVRISESPSRDLAFGNQWGFTGGGDPAAGQLYVVASDGRQQAFGPDGKPLPPSPPLALGFAVVDGIYLTIETTAPDLALAAARALEPAG